ncbi:MAG: dTDP-4-dehydrorhamnose 3,5-epimerase, partial [Acidobacteriota bacterium]
MKRIPTALDGVVVFEPDVFGDARGYFFESWHRARYAEAGLPEQFVQDNVSRSAKDTLRGLHVQEPRGQGKLVQVLEGEVFDVAVDVRAGSPTFGRWVAERLSSENRRQMYVPVGFAHGFCVVSPSVL